MDEKSKMVSKVEPEVCPKCGAPLGEVTETQTGKNCKDAQKDLGTKTPSRMRAVIMSNGWQ